MTKTVQVIALQIESWDRPCVMTVTRTGKVHYGFSPSYVGYMKDLKPDEIKQQYGHIADGDTDALDEIRGRLILQYPPREGVEDKDSPGWLLPDGRFFPCRSWEHDAVLPTVSFYALGQFLSTRDVEKTWIRVYDVLLGVRSDPTQAQIDTLGDILAISTSDRLKRSIRYCITEGGE